VKSLFCKFSGKSFPQKLIFHEKISAEIKMYEKSTPEAGSEDVYSCGEL
jgi:hypothetical protein